MKKISPQLILLFFAFFSALLVALFDFVFSDAPEIFHGGAKLAEISTNLSLAYISAYFFYIITIVIPKHNERAHIKEHASHLISNALHEILYIMQDSTNSKIPQKKLKLEIINSETFRINCKDVFMDQKVTPLRVGNNGEILTVGAAVMKNIQELQNTINELFKYSPHIETELVSLISAASINPFNKKWSYIYNMGPIQIGDQTMVLERTDTSIFSENLAEYQSTYKAIEEILIKKYKNTVASNRHVQAIKVLKES